jgi:hypothetical protein
MTDVETVETLIIGRAAIAHRLGRSERTVSRWITRGILPATTDGPFDNNLLVVRVADLEKLRQQNCEQAMST